MHFFNTSAGRLVLLSIGVVAISTAAPLIKLIPEVPSVLVAASRLGFASLILLPLGWRHRHAVGRHQPALVLAAGLCLALHFVSWIASLRYTSVASSVILVTLTPLLLVPAGYLMWGERPTRRLGLGIGLAIGGSVCIAWNDFQLSPPQALYGDLLALGGAVMMAAYLVCGRLVRPSVPLPLYAGLVYACAAVCLWAVCLLSPVSILGYTGSAYLILLLLGLGPQLIGHTVCQLGAGLPLANHRRRRPAGRADRRLPAGLAMARRVGVVATGQRRRPHSDRDRAGQRSGPVRRSSTMSNTKATAPSSSNASSTYGSLVARS